MSEKLQKAFIGQGKSCAMLGSPFMGRLMPLCAERLRANSAVAQRLLDWPGEVHAGAQSIPLRIAGALHGLVLDGSDADLTAVYPPHTAEDDALWAAIETAFERHEARLMAWLDQAPQTNEVRRSAVLLPAIWWVLNRIDRPVILSELGASAGLNLMLDRYALEIDGTVHGEAASPVRFAPDWAGPLPQSQPIDVADRAGIDLNPLDPTDATERLRLLAYLWPDQPDRLRLTQAAIDLSKTLPARGDAAAWLEDRLEQRFPGHLHIVYHSIAWQYFPQETQTRCRAALDAAGARATPDAPLAHIAMEADGDPKGAGLTVEIWPGTPNEPKMLARVDYHGRWINWQEK